MLMGITLEKSAVVKEGVSNPSLTNFISLRMLPAFITLLGFRKEILSIRFHGRIDIPRLF